jgi:hypothetical protein
LKKYQQGCCMPSSEISPSAYERGDGMWKQLWPILIYPGCRLLRQNETAQGGNWNQDSMFLEYGKVAFMDRSCFCPRKFRHRETVKGCFFQGLCFDIVCLFSFTCYSTFFRGPTFQCQGTVVMPMKLRLPGSYCRM